MKTLVESINDSLYESQIDESILSSNGIGFNEPVTAEVYKLLKDEILPYWKKNGIAYEKPKKLYITNTGYLTTINLGWKFVGKLPDDASWSWTDEKHAELVDGLYNILKKHYDKKHISYQQNDEDSHIRPFCKVWLSNRDEEDVLWIGTLSFAQLQIVINTKKDPDGKIQKDIENALNRL